MNRARRRYRDNSGVVEHFPIGAAARIHARVLGRIASETNSATSVRFAGAPCVESSLEIPSGSPDFDEATA